MKIIFKTLLYAYCLWQISALRTNEAIMPFAEYFYDALKAWRS